MYCERNFLLVCFSAYLPARDTSAHEFITHETFFLCKINCSANRSIIYILNVDYEATERGVGGSREIRNLPIALSFAI